MDDRALQLGTLGQGRSDRHAEPDHADKRKQALKLARDGVSVSLAHTIDKEKAADNPRPLGQEMVLDAGGHAMDLYSIWYHGSIITHIDSLCHYSFEGKIFNGFERSAIAPGPGCPSNGIENQKAGIMTRGILVDLPRMKNVPYLEPGTPVSASDLEAWEKYAGIKIGSGDALFLRTGRWARRDEKGPWNVAASAAGFHASVMPWLKQRDVALLGNDARQRRAAVGHRGIAAADSSAGDRRARPAAGRRDGSRSGGRNRGPAEALGIPRDRSGRAGARRHRLPAESNRDVLTSKRPGGSS